MDTPKPTEQEKCLAKLTWKNREEAEAAAAYARWQYGGQNSSPKPYHCKICNKWHLAKQVFDE